MYAGIDGRTSSQGYSGGDGVRQKFTQKERDIETGLDYFLARYYSSTQGRFTSPDEFSGGPREGSVPGTGDAEKQALPYADITQPQSLNKYAYTYNNPTNLVDPDGHCIPCVVVAVIAIFASAEYAEAPTGHPDEVLHPAGTGQRDLVSNIFYGEFAGAATKTVASPIMRQLFPRLFAEEAVGQVESRILAHAAQGSRFENRVLGIIGETKNTNANNAR
ncbi:MAG: RHS repeat-associated core domain-containing protein [Pyrinomonadaceae bacterium]